VLALCLVGILVVALGLGRKLAEWQVWALLAILACSPLAALVYASSGVHLNDPERVILPVGIVGWFVAAALVGRVAERKLLAVGLLATICVGSVVGALAGYLRWTGYASAQQDLLEAVAPVRADLPDDATMIVEDTTGKYGDVYLLLPPHLNIALDLQYGAGADGVLCTATGVARDQPVAALYPITATPDCAEYLNAPKVRFLGAEMTKLGEVRLYAVR
jgi:hypothetical protein